MFDFFNMDKFIAKDNYAVAKRRSHFRAKYCYEIPCEDYAAWIAQNKPNCRMNQRKAKRVKNKAVRAILARNGINYRVKTHDSNHPSATIWKAAQAEYREV